MLIVKNKRYVKKHVIGGAGIFDTITGFLKRLASSNAARSIASDIGKHAISAVGKELATSAISKAKDLAIEKGKQIIDSKPAITQKSKDILTSLINSGAGIEQNAIRIEDLVRKMNGGGLRLA